MIGKQAVAGMGQIGWTSRRWRAWLTRLAPLCLSFGLSACSTVYLNDPDLQARTSAVDDAVRAHPIDGVFAAHLGQLSDADTKEALAVARYMTAVRDLHLAELADEDDAGKRAALLRGKIESRLRDLVTLPVPADFVRKSLDYPDVLKDKEHRSTEKLNSYLDFRRLYMGAKGPLHDLSCGAIRVKPPYAESPLGRMQKACAEMEELRSIPLEPSFGGKPGPVAQAAAGDLKDAEANAALSSVQPTLDKIDDLIAFANKTPADERALVDKVQADLRAILEVATAVGAYAGLKKLDGVLGDVLQGSACTGPAADPASCGTITPTSIGGKAEGVSAFAVGLSNYFQATADKGRHGFSLQAAQAIAAARVADAKLRADAARAILDLRRRRLETLSREAVYLAEADQEFDPATSRCGEKAVDCALGLYVLSWERGRIPFVLAQFREDELNRETWVSRARLVAVSRETVLTSATASLKAYGASGVKIDAQVWARLLNAAGLTAVAATR